MSEIAPTPKVGAKNNSSFSTQVPLAQLAWDSTSIGTYKECPRKYYYSIVLGREPSEERVHLVFGQWYHKAMETFHAARASGADFDDALREAVRYCLEVTWNRKLGRAWVSSIPEKTRYTLVRSIVWYFEQFREDSLRTVTLANGKAAVELSFRMEIGETRFGEAIYMCGHMDRIVEFSGEIYISDYKTTKGTLSSYFFDQFTPHNQFSLYTFASELVYSVPVRGLIVDAAQMGVGFTRFQRGFVTRNKEQNEEWFRDFQYYIAQAWDNAERGYWPMNDKSCGNYGGCPFRPICAKPPSVREQWLNGAGFVSRQWNPLEVRGDV